MHHLLGLRADIAPADDRPGCVDGVLPANIHRLHRAAYHHRLREGWVVMQCLGVEVLYYARSSCLIGCVGHDNFLLLTTYAVDVLIGRFGGHVPSKKLFLWATCGGFAAARGPQAVKI